MPYDPTAPTVNTSLRVSNPILLADKAFLKNGLEREHTFVADETAGATGEHLRHAEGSGRAWIYDNALEATVPILAATYSQAKAHAKGYVVIDIQKGRIWYCTDGALDLWIEGSKLGGNLALGGNLTVGGTLGVTGNASLGGDLTLVTGKKLKVPPGESVILQSGAPALTMDPFAHATRHRPGTVSGVWDANADGLKGILQRVGTSGPGVLHGANVIVAGADVDAQVFGLAGDAKQSHAFSTVGRPGGSTSIFRVYAEAAVRRGVGGSSVEDTEIQMGLYLDGMGTRLGQRVYRTFEQNVPDGAGPQTMSMVRYAFGVTIAVHELALHLWSSAGGVNPPTCDGAILYVEDMGLT